MDGKRTHRKKVRAESGAESHRVPSFLLEPVKGKGAHNCASGASQRLEGRPVLLRLHAGLVGGAEVGDEGVVRRPAPTHIMVLINLDRTMSQSLLFQVFHTFPHCNAIFCKDEGFSNYHTRFLASQMELRFQSSHVSVSGGLMAYMALAIRYGFLSGAPCSTTTLTPPPEPRTIPMVPTCFTREVFSRELGPNGAESTPNGCELGIGIGVAAGAPLGDCALPLGGYLHLLGGSTLRLAVRFHLLGIMVSCFMILLSCLGIAVSCLNSPPWRIVFMLWCPWCFVSVAPSAPKYDLPPSISLSDARWAPLLFLLFPP